MNLFGKKFKCDVCGEKFKTKEELDSHASSHLTQAPQSPPSQSNEQVQPPSATKNGSAQSQNDQFKCQTCGASFETQDELFDHVKIHNTASSEK